MIRTRIAPSPTGFIHIGTLRTVLYNYAFAKNEKGEFILRIEDTDVKRYVPGSVEVLMDMLKLFGLFPDRYPTKEQLKKVGKVTCYQKDWVLHQDELERLDDNKYKDIYVQTLRLPLYQKYALELIKKGYAYFCFCTEERLRKLREEQIKKGQKPMYNGTCKKYTLQEAMEKIRAGERYVVRLDVQAYARKKGVNYVEHDDIIRGKIRFPLAEVDDQVIIKSNGLPTYHLAVVVDDHLMEITHPFRAAEWISSTPKQTIIYDALGWKMPRFAHLALILDPSGGKLSKRKGSVAAHEFIEDGYLPEALLNFLMLLGWSPKDNKEFFTLDEFIKAFNLEGLNKSNAIFNRDKLLWFNKQYIMKLETEEFVRRFIEWLDKYCPPEKRKENIEVVEGVKSDKRFLKSIVPLIRERVSTWVDALTMINFFYSRTIDYKEDGLKYIKSAKSNKMLKDGLVALRIAFKKPWRGHEDWEKRIRITADKLGWKHGDLFMALRIAVTGSHISPPLFESMELLGYEKCMRRIDEYVRWLVSNNG